MSVEQRHMAHLNHLCAEIGPRPMGSNGDHAAASYILRVFRAAGLEPEIQRWPCPAWEVEETRLSLGDFRLEATANWFSTPCDVAAAAVSVSSEAELASSDMSGRIAILYGDLTREPLSAKGNKIYNLERHQRIVRGLEQKHPVAVIAINPNPFHSGGLLADWGLAIPSATVSARVGLSLVHMDRPLHLRIVSHRSEGYSCNVVGRKAIQGGRRAVLCAHYDTFYGSPGAIDNASGVAVLLTLAERLGPRQLPVGLEFVAFGGEESFGWGDEEYLQRLGLEVVPYNPEAQMALPAAAFADVLLAMNVDGVGQVLGTNTLCTLACDEPMRTRLSSVQESYPGVQTVDPWMASNHYTFYSHGVPCLALGSTGVTNVTHLPSDTPEWIDSNKLHEVAALIEDVVLELGKA